MSEKQHAGWTTDGSPAIYHFEHIARKAATRRAKRAEGLHVVETVNWTYGDSDDQLCHLNKYFALNLSEALGLAALLALSFAGGGIAEDVVSVRPATADEEQAYWIAHQSLDRESPVTYD